STRLPILGRETIRFFAMRILMASRTAERLTWKSAAHFASFGRMVPGGNSPRTMLRPIASAIETWMLPRARGRTGTDRRAPAGAVELAGAAVVLLFSLVVSLRMSFFQFRGPPAICQRPRPRQ